MDKSVDHACCMLIHICSRLCLFVCVCVWVCGWGRVGLVVVGGLHTVQVGEQFSASVQVAARFQLPLVQVGCASCLGRPAQWKRRQMEHLGAAYKWQDGFGLAVFGASRFLSSLVFVFCFMCCLFPFDNIWLGCFCRVVGSHTKNKNKYLLCDNISLFVSHSC